MLSPHDALPSCGSSARRTPTRAGLKEWPRSCGALPERDAARRIALGAPPGTWRKLQEHLLHERRHQRFLDGLEAVLPAPEFDARTVDRKSTRLNSSH